MVQLSDFLCDLGRPVAYHPWLARRVGANAAILYGYLLSLHPRNPERPGWVRLSQADIQMDTALSPREQRTARKRLLHAGLIEENYDRLRHDMYYRLTREDDV